jgi:hypothetical protein
MRAKSSSRAGVEKYSPIVAWLHLRGRRELLADVPDALYDRETAIPELDLDAVQPCVPTR